jgi:hypothetical protein
VATIGRVAVRARSLLSRTSLRRKPYYVWRPQQLVRRVTGTVRLDPSTGLADVGLPWGGTIACWPHEAVGSGLARTGVHELAASEILARLGAPGEFVVDAGANVGYMTALLAWRVGQSGRVLAFEPHPTVAEVLRRTARVGATLGWAPTELRQLAIPDHLGKEAHAGSASSNRVH